MPRSPFRLLAALALLCLPQLASADPETLVRVQDAYVARDAAEARWSIGNAFVIFSVSLEPNIGLRVVELRNTRMTAPPAISPAADALVGVGGRQLALGSASGGFTLETFRASELPTGVRLDLVFTLREPRLRVTRSYACYLRSPVVEAWTSFEALAGSVVLEGLNAWQLTVPAATIRTVTGLMSDDATNGDPTRMRQFTIERRQLAPGGQLNVRALGRSSEETVPWFATEGADGTFFGGLMWSGSWALTAERFGASMRLTLGLPTTTTILSPDRPIEAPHGFFGVTESAGADLSLAMHGFILRGVRAFRPFQPLVLYNTWFAYGTQIDEGSMRDAVDAAARIGADVFVLDAGWHQGSGRRGIGDFVSGLGSWRTDPAKFPRGLRAIAEFAEASGLRFGIWVEPERVSLDNVGRPGLADERWLATRDGRYDPAKSSQGQTAAQLCLADARARQWVTERLVQLIDEVAPAYLKWDNNFWLNCNRSGHGHGAADGNFAHVTGLYQVLAELRARYPALLVENVTGGGNRLDFGMLRYTDFGWMDDRTTPAAVVRHNFEGLAQVFPPAYLLSFVLDGPGEPMRAHGTDLAMSMRSRMPGVLGLTFRAGDLSEEDETAIRAEIARYRAIVPILRWAAGLLLSPQVTASGPAWDVFQEVTVTGNAIVFAYQTNRAFGSVRVRPQGLKPAATYDITTGDAALPLSMSGAELMRDGFEVIASPASAAHVIVLRPRRADPVQ